MAFYNPQEDEDQQDPNSLGGGSQVQSGSSVITGGGIGGAAPAQKQNAPDRPGNFVNLQEYLNANKPQAAKLGDQAAGVINNSANQAREGITTLNQEAQNKITPTQSLAPDVVGKIQNNAESLTGDERKAVKNTASATYQGPQAATDLASYQAASDASNKAISNIDNSGTEQGRMNLVSQINSKPRTQGMNVFDNALLQAGGGREKLAQASTANQDVRGGLGAATQGIQNQIGRADDPSTPDIDESTGAIGQTNNAQANAYKTVQDSLNAWKTGFQPKVTDAQNALTAQQNNLSQDIADDPYGLSINNANLFGLNGGDRTYGLNLNDYINGASASDISAANVASPEDYARYGALADLSGDKNLIFDPTNTALAGSAPTSAVNKEKFLNDRTSAENEFNELAKNATISAQGPEQVAAGAGRPTASQSITDYLANGFKPNISSENPLDTHDKDLTEAYLNKAILDWLQTNNYNTQVNAPVDFQRRRPLGLKG